MRIAELSSRADVALPTIKFYLREQLLPAGERTSPNQSQYSEGHVERLRLIRALVDVGGLSIAAVREVLRAVDDVDMPLDWAFGVAQRSIPRRFDGDEQIACAESAPQQLSLDPRVAAVLDEQGWVVEPGNPGIPIVERIVSTMTELGHDELVGSLPAYARAAASVAEADLASIRRTAPRGRADMIEAVVIGTHLGESLFSGLRLVAQEHISRREFPAEGRES